MSKTRFTETLKQHQAAHDALIAKFSEHATIARNVFRKKNAPLTKDLAWMSGQRNHMRSIHSISIEEGLIKFKKNDDSFFISEKLFFSDMGTIAKHYRKMADASRKLSAYQETSAQALRDLDLAQRQERLDLENKTKAHTQWLTSQATNGSHITRARLGQRWHAGAYQYNWS